MDTIFALATAQGRAGVSVIRISGPSAWACAELLCGTLPKPRGCAVRAFRNGNGQVIDHGLVLCFQSPNSFTGDDIVEFHTHGSVAVVRAMLEALSATGLGRLAEAGEFTRRALENNKLDLAQVEGLAELLDAETESQRIQSVRIFSGELGQKVEVWRSDLIRAASLLEATIDFVDEDVPINVGPEVCELMKRTSNQLQSEISGTFVAERVTNGFEIAIVGAPNVGKSTLLNFLAGREAAITSDVAGTTRDVIEVRLDLGGLPVTFLDTAGIRYSDDNIEKIGIRRAIERANMADLRVFLGGDVHTHEVNVVEGDIVLRCKLDRADGSGPGVSGKTGHGVDELIAQIRSVLEARVQNIGVATNERHRSAMMNANGYLDEAQTIVGLGQAGYDLAAEELRFAVRSLEELIGRVNVENLLDEIFSSFCIGK